MISTSVGEWEIIAADGDLPLIYKHYAANADYAEEIDLRNSEGRLFFFGVRRGNRGWPSLVSAQRYVDARRSFTPCVLLVPETSLVFVGAGERLLCYDADKGEKLWEDFTPIGFWGWRNCSSFVLMSAELEFGVWNQFGKKLWSISVEPPWSLEVVNSVVQLDVMGNIRKYRLADGEQVE